MDSNQVITTDSFNVSDTISLLTLVQTPGIGAITARHLISYCGGVKGVFHSDYKKLIRVPGVGDKVARAILKKEALSQAEVTYERCLKENVELWLYTSPNYPSRLKSLYDAPLVLFGKGNLNLENRRTVGIVGTRKATEYGKSVTESIVAQLQNYAVSVISGLAYGIDITAHKACLRHNVPTLGVMASGIDIIYPSIHTSTALEMQKLGGIITESTFGTQPDFNRFPARNRVIAGLSDVIIVVESAEKGGGLITVDFALNYHKEVFAVPGNLKQPLSEGCNKLIQQNKAGLFTDIETMMAALNWNESIVPNDKTESIPLYEGATTEEGQVIALLRQRAEWQIDELAWKSEIFPGKLATILLHLEFQGIVKSLPGKKYKLIS